MSNERLGTYGIVHKNPENSQRLVCLYTDEGVESKQVLKWLLDKKITVWECDIKSAQDPTFVAPTLVGRDGTYINTRLIRIYLELI